VSFVTEVAGETVPPPLVTVQVTVTPATGWSLALSTRTARGVLRGAPVVPAWLFVLAIGVILAGVFLGPVESRHVQNAATANANPPALTIRRTTVRFMRTMD
jgi:hypothetical protein